MRGATDGQGDERQLREVHREVRRRRVRVEAIEPEESQTILEEAIDSVIDVEAFNHEIDQEKADIAFLQGVRNTVHSALADMDYDDQGTEDDDS
ncbi:MAG: hypothetical protein HQ582_17120 [Planctomycetes bacterium]|nr:hypothetical protein [Planctomycetota bacterium]